MHGNPNLTILDGPRAPFGNVVAQKVGPFALERSTQPVEDFVYQELLRHVVVSADGRSAKFGEEAFANLAVNLIGKSVREVKVDEQSFHILFTDASEILISLRPEHHQGPEAVDFQGQDSQWAVL